MGTTATKSREAREMVYLGARVPSVLIEEVRGLAEFEDRSVSSIVRVALNQYLAGFGETSQTSVRRGDESA